MTLGGAVGKTIHTVIAGLKGALEGLLVVAMACAIVALLPAVLTSLVNRGTVDIDAFVPRSMVSASQAATVNVEGSPAECATVRRALDDLVWPLGNSMPKIIVISAANVPPGDAATYSYPESTIRVSKDVVDDQGSPVLAHVLAHEIGHQVDCMYLDAAGRSEFMTLRGRDPQEDWEGADVPWANRPAEDFAEVFAAFDAPASGAMIRTVGGRTENPTKMRALMQRYELFGIRTSASPQMAMLLPLARGLSHDYAADCGALALIFGVAILSATAGAVWTMQDMVYVKRSQVSRRRASHHAGKAHPAGV